MAVPDRALRRLQNDYKELLSNPVDLVSAHPLEDNILEWHYVIRGPANSPYEGGLYHGKLVFPSDYPMKPPAIYMITPNGKFSPNRRLCLTISDFHPESWSPLWTASSVLIGLLSFMDDKSSDGQFSGSVVVSDKERKRLAKQSHAFNLRDANFCKYFADLAEESKRTASEG